MSFDDRWTIVCKYPFFQLFNDPFQLSLVYVITILFDDRWAMFFNASFFRSFYDGFVRLLNDRFQQSVVTIVEWTFVTNPFLRPSNDRFQRSLIKMIERRFQRSLLIIVERSFQSFLLKIVQRSFPTLAIYDRWAIVLNDAILRSLNDLSKLSHCTIVERSFQTILSGDCQTIVCIDS